MLHSSSFHFRKTKNMHRDHCERKLTGRHGFRDLSHIKLTDMFKSLRRRRLRRSVASHRSPVTQPRPSFPLPFTDHDSSSVQPPSPDLTTSPSLHISHYRSDAVSLLSATEEDCSSGMSMSSLSLQGTLPGMEGEQNFSPHRPAPGFPTSPLTFQLRSASMNDYLVEQLEQHMRRLNLGDASPAHGRTQGPRTSRGVETLPRGRRQKRWLPKDSSRDVPMNVCLASPSQRTVGQETPSYAALSASVEAQKPITSPPPHDDQNVVPMILITSVDAKHAKPLPPSVQRSSGTPFGPSNHLINYPTNVSSAKSERKMILDDPFTTHPHSSAYPPDYTLAFRLPPFPSGYYSSPAKYAPETPTPMCCDHFGDCTRGDLWEILHPPLVPGRLTLPPFKLPPLSTGLFLSK